MLCLTTKQIDFLLIATEDVVEAGTAPVMVDKVAT